MRLKWLGILALVIDLFLAGIRNNYGATLTGDSIIVLIMAFGLVLIIMDCRIDDKKYIESIRKEEQHGKGGDL